MSKAVALGTIIIFFLLCLDSVYATAQLGVKADDWIKCEYVSGSNLPSDFIQWVKVECLSAAGTAATLRVTTHFSNGAEQTEIMTWDVASGDGNATFQALIPANSRTGDIIPAVEGGSVTIAGERTGTYAGASRTVVYASLTQGDMQFSYCWDKETGIIVEVTLTQGSMSATFKATSTNIWQPYAEAQVGVKVDDWIKYELIVSGTTPPPEMPQWVKVEYKSIAGTTVTLKITMHMSDGTEHTETHTIDVASGSGTAPFQAIIPANSKTGDAIQLVTDGSVIIAGEATGTYAGASRTYVYASITEGDVQHTYRWDKQTGVLLEINLAQSSASIAYKATSTNIWQGTPSSNPLSLPNLPIEIMSICISTAIAIAIVSTAIIYTRRKPKIG
ncbi:MAG: hypothetical protein QXK86_08520 [Candidatus Bathyarchaeia archaeon]